MDVRPQQDPARARRVPRASSSPPPTEPIPFAPPLGRGRRLPAARTDEREPRRTSRRRRRSIAEVAAVIEAPRPPQAPTRDPSRWARFEALVIEAGVARERLLDAFPDVEDIEDVFLTPDEDLAACAATLVRSLLRAHAATAERIPARNAATVRCADCRHFSRSTTHPRLGRCVAGERASAAGGWWDTQRRECVSFTPIRPGGDVPNSP